MHTVYIFKNEESKKNFHKRSIEFDNFQRTPSMPSAKSEIIESFNNLQSSWASISKKNMHLLQTFNFNINIEFFMNDNLLIIKLSFDGIINEISRKFFSKLVHTDNNDPGKFFFNLGNNDISYQENGQLLTLGANSIIRSQNSQHFVVMQSQEFQKLNYIYTGKSNDNVYGNDKNNIIDTDAGDDYVDAGAGDDYVKLGIGNNIYVDNIGSDTVVGYSESYNQYKMNINLSEVKYQFTTLANIGRDPSNIVYDPYRVIITKKDYLLHDIPDFYVINFNFSEESGTAYDSNYKLTGNIKLYSAQDKIQHIIINQDKTQHRKPNDIQNIISDQLYIDEYGQVYYYLQYIADTKDTKIINAQITQIKGNNNQDQSTGLADFFGVYQSIDNNKIVFIEAYKDNLTSLRTRAFTIDIDTMTGITEVHFLDTKQLFDHNMQYMGDLV